jgi:hypothetical protein
VGLVALLATLLLTSVASAMMVDSHFYYRIDINVDDPDAWDDFYLMFPEATDGGIYHGTVTYDDTNIPDTGTYVMGWCDDTPINPCTPNPSPWDEIQKWAMNFESPVTGTGFFDPLAFGLLYDTRLVFSDGELSAIYEVYNAGVLLVQCSTAFLNHQPCFSWALGSSALEWPGGSSSSSVRQTLGRGASREAPLFFKIESLILCLARLENICLEV